MLLAPLHFLFRHKPRRFNRARRMDFMGFLKRLFPWFGKARQALPEAAEKPGTAVRGVIYHRSHEGQIKYLLVQRCEKVKNNKSKWQLPGGKKEETDSSLGAAYRREIKEELGSRFGPWWMRFWMPSYLGQHTYTRKGGMYEGKPTTHHAYLQKVKKQHVPELDPQEHKAHAWLTLEEVSEKEKRGELVPGVVELLRMAHQKLSKN